jgi:hypothetical protein
MPAPAGYIGGMRIRPLRPSLRACAVAASAVLLLSALAARAEDKPAAAPAKAAESKRAPDATQRAAMIEVLKPETFANRAAWITYSAGDTEGKALAEALGGIFKEAGWKVETSSLAGMRLKPGVMMLIADEDAPTWVQGAQEALEKSGLKANSASGYKSYYDEKKAENPSWPGVPLPKDAAYVIVVGPEPKS